MRYIIIWRRWSKVDVVSWLLQFQQYATGQQHQQFVIFFSFKSSIAVLLVAEMQCSHAATRPMIDPEFGELVQFVFESLANERLRYYTH